MEFLVRMTFELPYAPEDERMKPLMAQERARGRALVASGNIQRIWRVAQDPGAPPGTTLGNVAIWSAADPEALDLLISSLPLRDFANVEITPLILHPLEQLLGSNSRFD